MLGEEGKEELTPSWEQRGLWMLLLSTMVHAWCHGLAMPALARVAQPDPLWSWPSPHTSKW